jgi:hypothetical protein
MGAESTGWICSTCCLTFPPRPGRESGAARAGRHSCSAAARTARGADGTTAFSSSPVHCRSPSQGATSPFAVNPAAARVGWMRTQPDTWPGLGPRHKWSAQDAQRASPAQLVVACQFPREMGLDPDFTGDVPAIGVNRHGSQYTPGSNRGASALPGGAAGSGSQSRFPISLQCVGTGTRKHSKKPAHTAIKSRAPPDWRIACEARAPP